MRSRYWFLADPAVCSPAAPFSPPTSNRLQVHSTTVIHGLHSPVTCSILDPSDVPINHIFLQWIFSYVPNLTHAHLKPGHFHPRTQHWNMLYSLCETFPAALQSLCDLPVSDSHLSHFPRGGWIYLLSLRLYSLLNSLTLYLLQGQKQQQQPGKGSNFQGTQYSASLGLMKRGSTEATSFLPQSTSCRNVQRRWNILSLVKSHQIPCWYRRSFKLLYISHVVLCLQWSWHSRVISNTKTHLLLALCSVFLFNCWWQYQMV